MEAKVPTPFVAFNITQDDYANALRLQLRRHFVSARKMKLLIAAVFIICLIGMIATGFDHVWVIVSTWMLISGLAVPLVVYFLMIPRQAKKIYRQQKSLQQRIEASWSDSGYAAASATVTGVTPWNDYYGWSADDKMVILMYSSALFQMLPMHALSSQQAADLFAHLERSGLRRL